MSSLPEAASGAPSEPGLLGPVSWARAASCGPDLGETDVRKALLTGVAIASVTAGTAWAQQTTTGAQGGAAGASAASGTEGGPPPDKAKAATGGGTTEGQGTAAPAGKGGTAPTGRGGRGPGRPG